jgi:hypothetical protein
VIHLINKTRVSSILKSVDSVKNDNNAVAMLLDVAFHIKRKGSEILKDLPPNKNNKLVLNALDKNGFLRPNPHRKVKDINYVLAPKGFFLVNELKVENPNLLKDLEPKLL